MNSLVAQPKEKYTIQDLSSICHVEISKLGSVVIQTPNIQQDFSELKTEFVTLTLSKVSEDWGSRRGTDMESSFWISSSRIEPENPLACSEFMLSTLISISSHDSSFSCSAMASLGGANMWYTKVYTITAPT
jgi:hypothetical protein